MEATEYLKLTQPESVLGKSKLPQSRIDLILWWQEDSTVVVGLILSLSLFKAQNSVRTRHSLLMVFAWRQIESTLPPGMRQVIESYFKKIISNIEKCKHETHFRSSWDNCMPITSQVKTGRVHDHTHTGRKLIRNEWMLLVFDHLPCYDFRSFQQRIKVKYCRGHLCTNLMWAAGSKRFRPSEGLYKNATLASNLLTKKKHRLSTNNPLMDLSCRPTAHTSTCDYPHIQSQHHGTNVQLPNFARGTFKVCPWSSQHSGLGLKNQRIDTGRVEKCLWSTRHVWWWHGTNGNWKVLHQPRSLTGSDSVNLKEKQ